jgi:hypothetical protein
LSCGQADLKTDINIDGMTRYIRYVYELVVLEKVLGTNKSHKRFNINVLRKVSL